MVWLLRPRTPAGQPDLDHLNPDPSLRQRHLCGLTIIWGLQPDGPSRWTGGWLYDPKDGVTYDVTAELTASNKNQEFYARAPLAGAQAQLNGRVWALALASEVRSRPMEFSTFGRYPL